MAIGNEFGCQTSKNYYDREGCGAKHGERDRIGENPTVSYTSKRDLRNIISDISLVHSRPAATSGPQHIPGLLCNKTVRGLVMRVVASECTNSYAPHSQAVLHALATK